MQYDENTEKYGYEGEMILMKCEELKAYGMADPAIGDEYKMYKVADVDAAIVELKDVIHELQVDLESAKATAYADSVDAGMRERRLRRALYKACANWAFAREAIAANFIDVEDAKKWAVVEAKCIKKAEKYK